MAAEEATSQELWQETVRFINNEFGKDIESLSKARSLYDQVKTTKESLEKQLTFASTEAPSLINKAVHDAEETAASIERLQGEQEKWNGEVNLHLAEVANLNKKLSGLTEQIRELEQYSAYLQLIGQVQDLSSDIQSALIIDAVDSAVEQFSEMAELAKVIQSSQCRHLVKFVNETVIFWYQILKDKFSSEFGEVLRAYHWPFIVSTAKPSTPITNVAEVKGKLGTLFNRLLQLQLPDGLMCEGQAPHPMLSSLPGWSPPVLPLQLMLASLKKRFHFHFYGKKQTNSIEKPEWYFTLVLTWLKDHQNFLSSKIQPLLEKADLRYTTALVEFTRGLVMLVLEKMLADLREMLYDEHIFSHFIDETLSFDRQLRTVYGYPGSQPGPLHILTQEKILEKWILIEKKFAMEKMDDMFSKDSAWQSQYKDVEVLDRKVPECCEAFVTLLLTITERYKPLPTAAHRVRFMDLQLELLDDYRIRLLQIRNEAAQDPLSHVFCAILNTVNYIGEVLQEWKELDFFVRLQYHKEQEENPQSEDSLLDSSTISAGGSPHRKKSVFASLYSSDNPAPLKSASVFDNIISLLDHMQNDMLKNSVLRYIIDDVKARSLPYRRDKWLALPSQKELFSLDLSSTACEMFFILKSHLAHIEEQLSKSLFQQLWPHIAIQLNQFIYNEVILANHFNDGGGAQLNFDMTRNLFPLFGQYTLKPENYFKDVKEACVILTTNVGSALLLKEVIYEALHNPRSDPNQRVTDPVTALHDLNIYKLEPEDVELVLSRRTNLTT